MLHKIKLYAIAALAFIAAIASFGASRKRQGKKEEKQKQREVDHEKANDIRNRVDDVDRVPDDKLKFRD